MAYVNVAAQAPGYDAIARGFHWVTATLVVILIVVGLVMTRMPEGDAQTTLFDLHRSIGWLILPLAILRLGYRATHPAPPLPADIPALQQFAAHASHWLLYAILIVQPLIGWLGMSTYGEPVRLFWLVDVPSIWSKDEALSEKLFIVHTYLGYALAALICVHIAAALFHHFVRRDNVLTRMTHGR
jgi:cytochrome b561